MCDLFFSLFFSLSLSVYILFISRDIYLTNIACYCCFTAFAAAVDHTMSFYFIEPGAGSKDTNLTLDLIVMNILARKRAGHKVLMLVSDCGPHQHK